MLFKWIKYLILVNFRIFRNYEFMLWYCKYAKKILSYKNIHQNEDCFIIGNGPSLNKMDLTLLNDYYTFGLNKIHLIFEKQALNLSYHVVVNPLVISQTKEELESNKYNCTSFISYLGAKNVISEKKNIIKIYSNLKWSFYGDISEGLSEGYTVTFVAMQLAYFMGFKRIFLVGIDHYFKQSGSPNECQLLSENDENHFHSDYFKGQNWHLADIMGNEASYALAKHQFYKSDRIIYDATIDGQLKIFEKISIEKALKIAKKKN